MDIDHNTNCYNIKEINYESGFFDNCVDATYVIHLENNGRLNHINKQLEQFQPTKKVYIAINKGFKNCNKKLIEQVSYQDLTDAFLQCFKHANERNYNNILILEDDFIFNPEIKDSKNINSLNSSNGGNWRYWSRYSRQRLRECVPLEYEVLLQHLLRRRLLYRHKTVNPASYPRRTPYRRSRGVAI
jgi:hypothetical protein